MKHRWTAVALLLMWSVPVCAQTARISESVQSISTYAFSEPNPVPILVADARLYPYHRFEGYSHTSEPSDWTVVKLENDLVEVFVLPEVGGKVWGAVVKATGHEFIYRNEVLKFRNIALRGPWTSGGIEFNFGVIGHTPSTATPVDYVLRENDDGSVSCIVGTMDLPSRTEWRVEIRLPADQAAFETRVTWYNPTAQSQPYYNWMTAAAFARDDLLMSIPGNRYLTHPGEARAWPTDDQGRFLPRYLNNTFDGHKSYHVVGEPNDFFGGYYEQDDYGFGHWARYDEMPGQKLWLWALSREGGVWDDLLTDTDGQYVEYQAGRLLVQYSATDAVNPITEASFEPGATDRWTDVWFPVEGLGGLSAASPLGAMHIGQTDDALEVSVHAFGAAVDTLRMFIDGRPVLTKPLVLDALQPQRARFSFARGAPWRVELPALRLRQSSERPVLSQPFETDPGAALAPVDSLVRAGEELVKARRYGPARTLFDEALAAEPWHRDALVDAAALAFRQARYADGISLIRRALQLDGYDAEANFIAGNLYRATGHLDDARASFGWAARSMAFRSVAYVQLAELSLAQGDTAEADRFALLALDFNRYSVPALEIRALSGHDEALEQLLEIDPLHHFVAAARWLSDPSDDNWESFASRLRGEYPEQAVLEIAIGLANRGLPEAGARLLARRDASDPVSMLWRAFLFDEPALIDRAAAADVRFAFPYRRETLAVLAWADARRVHWKIRYLFALNAWALGDETAAKERLTRIGDRPDAASFYVARAHFGVDPEADLRRAVSLADSDRSTHIALVRYLQQAADWPAALAASEAGLVLYPDDFNLALIQARSLLHLGRSMDALALLETAHVLPSENARESHLLYEQALVMAALDAMDTDEWLRAKALLNRALEWPEHLGQGRPYAPDERLVQYLLGYCSRNMNDAAAARDAFLSVIGPDDLLTMQAQAALDGTAADAPAAAMPMDPVEALVARAVALPLE